MTEQEHQLTEEDIAKLNARNIYTKNDLNIAKTMDFIHDSLVLKVENRKCLRSFFEVRYLPFFKGEVEFTEEDNYVQEWVTIAGSYGNRVDVMNPDGSVAYVVPPLIDTSRFSRNVDNYSHISRRTYDFFQRRGRANQQSSDQFFTEINGGVVSNEDNELLQNEWYKMFSLADGRPLEELKENVGTTETVNNTNVKFSY